MANLELNSGCVFLPINFVIEVAEGLRARGNAEDRELLASIREDNARRYGWDNSKDLAVLLQRGKERRAIQQRIRNGIEYFKYYGGSSY